MATCCGARLHVKVSRSENNKDKEYVICGHCNTFQWLDQVSQTTSDAGPDCKCNPPRVSVQRAVVKAGPNKGRKFWTCAQGRARCGFFEWREKTPQGSPPQASRRPVPNSPTRPFPGYAQYQVNWKQNLNIKTMMGVASPEELGGRYDDKYDTLEVVGAWRIINKERKEQYDAAKKNLVPCRSTTPDPFGDASIDYDAAWKTNEQYLSPSKVGSGAAASRETVEGKSGDGGGGGGVQPGGSWGPVRPPPVYAAAMGELAGNALDETVGELMLLHGTDPECLHSILFEGLNPKLAREGLFGRGTYLAENAAKIDQYTPS